MIGEFETFWTFWQETVTERVERTVEEMVGKRVEEMAEEMASPIINMQQLYKKAPQGTPMRKGPRASTL